MGDMTRLLLLLWAGVTVSTAMDLYKRIVGGRPCGNNERHYHVQLSSNTGRICGGSLISDRWVLTAAHCSTFLNAYLGLHPRQRRTIDPIVIIEPPVIFDQNHDIMMLKLPVASQIPPVALPEDCVNRPIIGNEVQIAGYGPTAATGGTPSRTLQCANTKVDDCPPEWVPNPDRKICFNRNVAHPTEGDSGGGVVFNNRIYGVISDQISSVDVCEFLNEIRNTMNTP